MPLILRIFSKQKLCLYNFDVLFFSSFTWKHIIRTKIQPTILTFDLDKYSKEKKDVHAAKHMEIINIFCWHLGHVPERHKNKTLQISILMNARFKYQCTRKSALYETTTWCEVCCLFLHESQIQPFHYHCHCLFKTPKLWHMHVTWPNANKNSVH